MSPAKWGCVGALLWWRGPRQTHKNFPTKLLAVGDLDCQINIDNIDRGAKFSQLLLESNYIKNVLPLPNVLAFTLLRFRELKIFITN